MSLMNWRAALDRVRALVGALDRDAAIAHALVLASDRDLNLDLASALDSDQALDRERVLVRAAMSARNLARALDLALGSALDGDYAPDRAASRDLDLSRDLASALARYLDRHSATPVEVNAEGARSLPRRVRVAVRLLPRSWRPRYREEFRAELARLSPGERSEYARRVLAEVWQLRRVLAGTQCPPDRARVEG